NASNEVVVGLFLNERIGFMDIPRIIEKTMNRHSVIKSPELEDIIETDAWARKIALEESVK
ncbi:MAG TPA: 1-deoxy-D-xylulose-5-phosphate reductoisomerase, partial [Clostridia bacterium]